jgi:hypothetical protein
MKSYYLCEVDHTHGLPCCFIRLGTRDRRMNSEWRLASAGCIKCSLLFSFACGNLETKGARVSHRKYSIFLVGRSNVRGNKRSV